ncbi:MAG TPA: hypothetical protein VMD74_02835 [Candidatus Methylomirabilis sp.]|nr:hypothetical protein [Candidatus Methylomirabilis sp.]
MNGKTVGGSYTVRGDVFFDDTGEDGRIILLQLPERSMKAASLSNLTQLNEIPSLVNQSVEIIGELIKEYSAGKIDLIKVSSLTVLSKGSEKNKTFI